MTSNQNTPAPAPTNPPEPAAFLTMHSALVLLIACFIGMIVGILTFLNGVPVAGAVLAGFTGAGAGVPVLRSLIR